MTSSGIARSLLKNQNAQERRNLQCRKLVKKSTSQPVEAHCKYSNRPVKNRSSGIDLLWKSRGYDPSSVILGTTSEAVDSTSRDVRRPVDSRRSPRKKPPIPRPKPRSPTPSDRLNARITHALENGICAKLDEETFVVQSVSHGNKYRLRNQFGVVIEQEDGTCVCSCFQGSFSDGECFHKAAIKFETLRCGVSCMEDKAIVFLESKKRNWRCIVARVGSHPPRCDNKDARLATVVHSSPIA